MKEVISELTNKNTGALAIVNVGCRFPNGTDSLLQFWQYLNRLPVSAEQTEKTEKTVRQQNIEEMGFILSNRFFDDIASFDADFFSLTIEEAKKFDAHQRMLLECCQHALEYRQQTEQVTGFFLLAEGTKQASLHRVVTDKFIDGLGLNRSQVHVTEQAYSMMSAFNQACVLLRENQISQALVGGSVLYPELEKLTPDETSKNTAEGCVVLLIKRLDDAIEANDPIMAIIRGYAFTHNLVKEEKDSAIIEHYLQTTHQALTEAEIDINSVGYVELDNSALAEQSERITDMLVNEYCGERTDDNPLLFSSVKEDTGNLVGISLLAALLKLSLVFKYHYLPKQSRDDELFVHQTKLAQLKLAQDENVNWNVDDTQTRIAALASFNSYGEYIHIVLQAPAEHMQEDGKNAEQNFFMLSAKTPEALTEWIKEYPVWLAQSADSLSDICFTASDRTHYPYRQSWLVDNTEELLQQMANYSPLLNPLETSAKLVWLFGNDGVEYHQSAIKFYQTQPVYRHYLNECQACLDEIFQLSITQILWGEEGDKLDHPGYVYPVLFSIQYALGRMWQHFGLIPDAVMGYGVGEFSVACLSGVFSLKEALLLVVAYAQRMEQVCSTAAMVEIMADESQVMPLLDGTSAFIAAYHGSEQLIVSGSMDDIAIVAARAMNSALMANPLPTSYVGYCPASVEMSSIFCDVAKYIKYQLPRYQYISSWLGKAVSQELTQPEYWIQHAGRTVYYWQGLAELYDHGFRYFLETGPGSGLTDIGKTILPQQDCYWLITVSDEVDYRRLLQETISVVYQSGKINLNSHYLNEGVEYNRVWLPSYPFQRQFVMLPPEESDETTTAEKQQPIAGNILQEYKLPFQQIEEIEEESCYPNSLFAHPGIQSALSREWIFATNYQPDYPYAWENYQIKSHCLMPVSMFIFSIFQVAEAALISEEPILLREINIYRFLPLCPSQSKAIQTVAIPRDSSWKITYLSHAETEWVVHCDASVSKENVLDWQEHEEMAASPQLPDEESLNLAGKDYYSLMSTKGLHYDETLQLVDRVYRQPFGVWARLVNRASSFDIPSKLMVMDACLQMCLASQLFNKKELPIFPTTIEAIILKGGLTDVMWCHAKKRPGAQNTNATIYDVILYNEEAEVIWEIKGVSHRTLTEEDLPLSS